MSERLPSSNAPNKALIPAFVIGGMVVMVAGVIVAVVAHHSSTPPGPEQPIVVALAPATQPTRATHPAVAAKPTVSPTSAPATDRHAAAPPVAKSASAPTSPIATNSDFAPDPSLVPRLAPTTAPTTSPQSPSTAPSIAATDFAPRPTTNPSDRSARLEALAKLRGISDAEVAGSIRHGVDFLLSQFKDGEISPDVVLSDSQRQSLDALCVYALAQAGESINDPRLNPRGTLLPAMLAKLRGYEMVSDGKTTNRPLTYGRSLRAAALASYNREEDRETLKQDVAWLIKTQVHGAYTYDDLYTQLIAQGIKAAPEDRPGSRVPLPTAPANQQGANEFVGGSTAPPIDPGDQPYGSSPQYPDNGHHYNFPQHPHGAHHCIPSRFGLNQALGTPLPLQVNAPPPRRGFAPPRNGPGAGGIPVQPGNNVPDPENPHAPPIESNFVFLWDNSNSQYGLLGVWAGAEIGIEVPDQYWKDVQDHWVKWQLRTAEWSYRAHDPHGYLAMTAAGVASLLVTHDYLDIPQLHGTVGRPPYSPSLEAGLAWLESGDNSVSIPNQDTHYAGYDLFGIERVGLASGYKYFGAHDWYRELAGLAGGWQFPNGAWGHEDHGLDSVVETAYALLFLSRGRHPVMMTKLKFGKYWDNRPRDVANLAKFTGKELERPLNWQVVSIDHDWPDYFDSPVLYIASHQAPSLKPADYQKLRNFVMAGGLIFTQADGASASFNAWVPQLAQAIAPGYALKPLPDNSPVYTIQYKVASHPPMLGISNGSRLLLVHSPADLSQAWQERSTKTRKWAFEIGANIFIYASGKPDLRNRLENPYLPPTPTTPEKSVRVAQLKYEGNWNPEPAAWFRFSRYMQWEEGERLDLHPVAIEQLKPGEATLVTLTGTDAVKFSDAQAAALREYVTNGGILLIDACGGENAFTNSVRDELLPTAFGNATAQLLGPEHPLFKGLTPGQSNSSPIRLRPYAIDRLGRLAPPIRLLKVGKGYVLFSPMDLTSGLLGTTTWGILGYESSADQEFLKNLVVWCQAR